MKDEKMIEEMAELMCDEFDNGVCKTDRYLCNHNCYYRNKAAVNLYNAGYRKQSEGKWTWEHDLIRDPKRYFIRVVCSCCGLKTGETSNYCPNCGAKMKGGAEQ